MTADQEFEQLLKKMAKPSTELFGWLVERTEGPQEAAVLLAMASARVAIAGKADISSINAMAGEFYKWYSEKGFNGN